MTCTINNNKYYQYWGFIHGHITACELITTTPNYTLYKYQLYRNVRNSGKLIDMCR